MENKNSLFTMTDQYGQPLPKLNSAVGGISYSVAVLAIIIVTILYAIVVAVIKACGVPEGSVVYLYLQFLASPVAIAATVAIVLKKFKINFKEIAPVKCKPKYYLIAVLLVLGLLFALSWVNTAFVEFSKLFGYEESAALKQLEEHLVSMSGWELIPALLIIAAIPAVMEELLFRGLILANCNSTAGSIATVFLCGFAFSLFHGSPEQTVYQFLLGCIFALITIRSGSIIPAILMHFINNGLVVVLYFCNAYAADGSLKIPLGGEIALTVVAALCMIGGIIWLILDKTPLVKGQKGAVKKFFLFASVGIAIMALMWIFSLFGVS